MFRRALARTSFVAVVFLSLIFLSCLERTEEITVSEDGTTTIIAKFKGEVDNFRPPVALPLEPEWEILEKKVDSSDIEHIRMELKAKLVVPYGMALPETYAKPDAAVKSVNLQFPTEVRNWTEGKRTFYEFKRTYLARGYGYYNITGGILWDQELENRVLEKGIFDVSEEDRTKYLDQFASAFRYLHWRFLWETLGTMVRGDEIPVSTKENVETWAVHYLESVITPVRILGILGQEDDSIGVALDRLEDELHDQFVRYFLTVTGQEQTDVQENFEDLLHTITLDYDVTEALNVHQFSVDLRLPGTIIGANGLIDPEIPGFVEWVFKGEDLHDKDIRLYALSVVDH